jgi:hypothetical protein
LRNRNPPQKERPQRKLGFFYVHTGNRPGSSTGMYKTGTENKIGWVCIVLKKSCYICSINSHQNKIKMSTDQLQLLINLHGSREVSIRLINSRLNKFVGLDMNDLPDTSELCDVIDELQEVLDSKTFSIDEIKDVLNNIDMEFIQDMVFG